MNTIMRRRAMWGVAALLMGGTIAGGALTAVPARAATNPLIEVGVTGSQSYGSSAPQFTFSYLTPESAGTVSGTVTCTDVNSLGAITPTLPVFAGGAYQIAPDSCSGLSVPSGDVLEYRGGPFTVTPASQAISFTALSAGTYGQTATLTATGGGSGNPVTFSVDSSSGAGVCSVSGDTLSYTGTGTCVIDANQAGDGNYTAAPQVQQSITVDEAPQTITFTVPVAGAAPGSESLTATGGGSGNPVTFSVDPSSGSDVCSISGDMLSFINPGTCIIDANEAGNSDYLPGQATDTIPVANGYVLGLNPDPEPTAWGS